jgi:hypothetical protein
VLLAHCDDRQLSGLVLANLCQTGDASMKYVEDVRSANARRGAVRRPKAGRRGTTTLAYQLHLGPAAVDPVC